MGSRDYGFAPALPATGRVCGLVRRRYRPDGFITALGRDKCRFRTGNTEAGPTAGPSSASPVTDDAVRAAVTLSRRYLTGRQLPDKAVDLLDTASARVRMSLDTVPEPLTRIRSQITALEMEKQALLEDIALGNQSHGKRLSAIEQEENDLIVALDELETQYGQELKLTEQLLESRQDTGARNVESLLNQQILPVLSQQLLTYMAAKQKPQFLMLGWSEDEGISLDFNRTEGVNA